MAWMNPYLMIDNQLTVPSPTLAINALRRGESLTYYHQPQGRFHQAADSLRPKRLDPDPSSSFAPVFVRGRGGYANACIRWRPRLQGDLKEPGIQCVGFDQVAEGLLVRRPNAILCYRLSVPHTISGRYTGSDLAARRIDGLLVRLSASALPAIAIRAADDHTEKADSEQDGCDYFADLTFFADGQRQYELTVSLPPGQILRSIAIDTWCELPSVFLPDWCHPGRPARLMIAPDPAADPVLEARAGATPPSMECGGRDAALDSASAIVETPGATPESFAGVLSRHAQPQAPLARKMPADQPLDVLLRWRHDSRLRTFRKRFTMDDIGEPFAAVPEARSLQPLHVVLSVP